MGYDWTPQKKILKQKPFTSGAIWKGKPIQTPVENGHIFARGNGLPMRQTKVGMGFDQKSLEKTTRPNKRVLKRWNIYMHIYILTHLQCYSTYQGNACCGWTNVFNQEFLTAPIRKVSPFTGEDGKENGHISQKNGRRSWDQGIIFIWSSCVSWSQSKATKSSKFVMPVILYWCSAKWTTQHDFQFHVYIYKYTYRQDVKNTF